MEVGPCCNLIDMAKKKKIKSLGLQKLRNKYGSGNASDVLLPTDDWPWLPSTSLALNFQLGGGVPYGRILELFGQESSGKSLISYDFAYVTQQLGGQVLLADAEGAFTIDWAEKNGLDPNDVEVLVETSIEKISDWAAEICSYYRSQLTENEPILLVIDSLAALETDDNLDTQQYDAKAEMGGRAKAIGKFLRLRAPLFIELGITVILINQLRKKVGASKYEDPDTTTGGAATKFFSSQRLGVFGGKQIKDKINGTEAVVGRETSIRIKKNKVAPPRASYKTNMVFTDVTGRDLGVDKYLGLFDMLRAADIVRKAKPGSNKLFLGESEESCCLGERGFEKVFSNEKNADIKAKIIKAANINTLSRTEEHLERLDKNLFPIEDDSKEEDDDE